MNTEMSTVRLVGAAQLLVFVGAVITDRLLVSAVGSGGISDMLLNISNNLPRMRISNLVSLGQSLAIIVLVFCIMSSFTGSTTSSRLWA
jgi:hypothetical protein